MTPEELLKEVGEPVAFLHQWIEYHPYGDTVAGEPCSAITNDGKPFDKSDTVTPLFTSDQVAAAVLKATKPLEDQLAAAQEEIQKLRQDLLTSYGESEELSGQLANAEQRVAEATEMTQTIEQLQAKVAELEEENELLKGRKNVELAANTDNAKSKQQWELAGPMEMGQLLAGSTHKTSGDLEIERTKPVTWIHKGGGFISDSRGKFIGCFSGDFRYRDRIICAVNSESETSNQLAAEQLNNKLLRDALEFLNARIVTMDLGGLVERALSTPASTEALDKYVAEKVKEAGKFDMWKINPYTKVLETSIKQLTKQRDLAVEALKERLEYAGIIEERCDSIATDKARAAIKESDGK